MFIQMFRQGLPVLAIGLLCPAGMAFAQDSQPIPAVAAPAKVPAATAPTETDPNEIAPTETAPPATVPAETKAAPSRIMSGLPGSAKRIANKKPVTTVDGDVWKKHPPPWTIVDPTPYAHPYAKQAPIAPGIGAYPGGPSGQFGSPYYYRRSVPDTAFGGGTIGNASYGPPPGGPIGGAIVGNQGSIGPGATPQYHGGPVGPSFGAGYGAGFNGGYGAGGGVGGYGVAGGYGAGGGVPSTAALPGDLPANPYLYHFGPGFYRHQEAGHYSFPYYSYRRPWYFPGHPSYNRDTNIPW